MVLLNEENLPRQKVTMDDFVRNVLILFDDSITDPEAKKEANYFILNWMVTEHAIQCILEILQNDFPLPVYNTVLSGIKTTLKYRCERIVPELSVPLILNLINFLGRTTEGLNNLALNCIAAIYIMTADCPSIFSLFQEKQEFILQVVNEICINFIEGLYKKYNLLDVATEKLTQTINVFMPIFLQFPVTEKWIETAGNIIKSYDDFGSLTPIIEHLNASLATNFYFYKTAWFLSRASELIVNSENDEVFIMMIFEMTKNVIQLLTQNQTEFSTFENIMLISNSFLETRCTSFWQSEDYFTFLQQMIEFVSQNFSCCEELKFFLEHMTSVIDDSASQNEEFKQLVLPLFHICVYLVDNEFPHDDVNKLFERLFIISSEEICNFLVDSDVSNGIFAASAYIGVQRLPVEVIDILCQKLFQLGEFPFLCLFFIRKVGYIMKKYVFNMIQVALSFIEIDTMECYETFANVVSANSEAFRDYDYELIRPFVDELQKGFNPYLTISLVAIYNVNPVEELIGSITNSVLGVISQIVQSNDENLIKNLLDMICVFSNYFNQLKINEQTQLVMRQLMTMIFDLLENISTIDDDFVQNRICSFLTNNLINNLIENLEKLSGYIQYVFTNNLVRREHICLIPFVRDYINHDFMRENIENYDLSDPEISIEIFNTMSNMAKLQMNAVWTLFGWRLPVKALYCDDLRIQKAALSFIIRSTKLEKPEDYVQETLAALNNLLQKSSNEKINEFIVKAAQLLPQRM